MVRPVLVDPAVAGTKAAGQLQTAEAVGEDLIAHPIAKPGGDGLGAVIDGELVFLGYFQIGGRGEVQPEGVPDQPLIVCGDGDVGRKGIHPQGGILPDQGIGLLPVLPLLKAEGNAGLDKAQAPGRMHRQLDALSGGYSPEGSLALAVPGVEQAWVKVFSFHLFHGFTSLLCFRHRRRVFSSAAVVKPFWALK